MKKRMNQEQLCNQPYLSKAEIARWLSVPRTVAYKIYEAADQLDKEELRYRVYDTKVRKSSVIKVSGLTGADISHQ
jgi:hypothetical protein